MSQKKTIQFKTIMSFSLTKQDLYYHLVNTINFSMVYRLKGVCGLKQKQLKSVQ